MATGHPRNFLRLSGSLVADPTALNIAFPYGGTALGIVRDCRLELGEGNQELTAEEFGGARVEYIRTAPSPVLAAVLREYDSDALARCFANVSVGASSGKSVVIGRATAAAGQANNSPNVRPGTLASGRSVKLLVAPLDPQHPTIILYNAIPLVDASAALQMELGGEYGIAVVFRGTPRTSDGQVYQVGLLEDLSL